MSQDRPSSVETRALTILVSDRVFAGLVDHGRKVGYTPTLMAKALFEAGWAARVGKGVGDPLLEACVDKSFERRPAIASAPVARLVPIVETRVVHDAIAVPVPVLVPVPIAVPMPVRVEPEALAVHVSSEQPLTEEASRHLATLIGCAVAKFSPDPPPATAETAADRPLPGWSASQVTFARLVCREEGASYAEVKRALAPAYQRNDSLSVLVSAVRKKLALLGVHFEAVDVWGWRVVAASRPAADAFLRRVA